jgi:hypothetical protein
LTNRPGILPERAARPDNLLDEPEVLKALVREQQLEIAGLQEYVNILLAKRYGPSDEKVPQGELRLGVTKSNFCRQNSGLASLGLVADLPYVIVPWRTYSSSSYVSSPRSPSSWDPVDTRSSPTTFS